MSKRSRPRPKESAGKAYRIASHDYFIENEWAVEALFERVKFLSGSLIIDPCCGSGTIVRVARKYGYSAMGSDIHPERFPDAIECDFLKLEELPPGLWNIVMNPPYMDGLGGGAVEFIEHALKLDRVHKVCALVGQNFKLSWDRYHLFKSTHPPAQVLFFSDRPSMPPGDMLTAGTIKAEGGYNDFDWIVWDKAYTGPTTCDWLLNPRKPIDARKKKKKAKNHVAPNQEAAASAAQP